MYELLYASSVVFIASAVQSITGSGFAIVAGPFLVLLYNSQEGVQVSTLLSFFIAAALTPKIKQHIDYSILKKLILGSILGVPLGLLFFAYTPLGALKLTIGLVVLALTMYSMFMFYKDFAAKRARQLVILEASGERLIESTKFIKKRHTLFREDGSVSKKSIELLVGFFAGALTTSVNMPGVSTAIYFNNGNFKNEVVRSTTLAFFIVVYIISMVMQLITVGISKQVFISSIELIPSVTLGIIMGSIMFKKINRSMFQLITNGILLYMGIYIVAKAL